LDVRFVTRIRGRPRGNAGFPLRTPCWARGASNLCEGGGLEDSEAGRRRDYCARHPFCCRRGEALELAPR
jgi:hypothetical protein